MPIYQIYTGFELLGIYGISAIGGYLLPNPIYSYMSNIYGIWFGYDLWHINYYGLFNTKFCFYKLNIYNL